MGTKHVLIVDDAIDLGRLLQDALRTAHPGLPISVVPSAEEAILESTRITIDLLITDIRLPGMTGLELVHKIRVRQPNVKVMLISGLSIDARMKKQLDDVKADAFLHKPMGMPEFLRLCSSLLQMESKPLVLDKPSEQRAPARKDEALLGVLAEALPGVPPEEITVKPAGASADDPQPSAAVEPPGLSSRLAAVRVTLGAVAVILLDESGHRVEQAGELPDLSLLDSLVQAVMTALSASNRLPYLLSAPSARGVQAYRGKDYDLVLAPVGQFAIMVVLRPGRSGLRLALAFEEILQLEDELTVALEELGLHMRSAAEVGASEKAAMPSAEAKPQNAPDELEAILAGPIQPEPGLDKLEELLAGQASESAGPNLDADSFWDTAAGTEKPSIDTPGVLSYEQAKKLGLLP